MLQHKPGSRAKRRPAFESLEQRLCMAAPALQASFALPQAGSWTGTVYRASPIFADVNDDGRDELILVAVGSKLIAYTQGANGSATPAVTYQAPNATANIKSTPLVVTNPRTGRKELYAGMGRDEMRSGTLEDGRIFGWDLATGQLLPGWGLGQTTGPNVGGENGVYGALASGDLDGDGVPEIIATSFNTDVMAYRLDGSLMWSYTSDDTILSGAVVGDIDRDGRPEVVVGGDSSASPFFQSGGWVTILSNDGRQKFRKQIPGEVTWSSPVLADLYNDGYLQIIIGTGLNFDIAGLPGARAAGNYLYAFDYRGNTLPGWPYHLTADDTQARQVLAAPAVADLDGDGQLEVIAVDRAGFLHAVRANGQPLPAFAGGLQIAAELGNQVLSDNWSSPIVADITGDGRPEIIASSGPFLRGFDADGNMTPIATTITTPGTPTPQGIDSAAAVGRFNGGSDYTLAFVSFNPFAEGRPDQVGIYQLPATAMAPEWPMIRRTAIGVAVRRSSSFDRQYVRDAFQTFTGTIPDDLALAPFFAALDANTLDLTDVTQIIATSEPTRGVAVDAAYLRVLGRQPEPEGRAAFLDFLATRTVREMIAVMADSPEFFQKAGSNYGAGIALLYQALLNRSASQAEVDAWAATGLPLGAIASRFLASDESIGNQLNAFYQRAFGPGSEANIPADTQAAFAYDIRQGVREDVAFGNLVVSEGAYATTNAPSSYIRSLYRDLLQRDGSPAEIASWVRAVDLGQIGLFNIASVFLNSVEARRLHVNEVFLGYLGRPADEAAFASLGTYARREDLVIFVVSSDEFFLRSGGTNASFVRTVYRDLANILPAPEATVNDWVARINSGMPRSGLVQALIVGNPLYGNKIAADLAFRYLPDESLGVLRSGKLPPSAPGQPINPNPALIAYLSGFFQQGQSTDALINILVTSPTYYNNASYFEGLFRSAGIRI